MQKKVEKSKNHATSQGVSSSELLGEWRNIENELPNPINLRVLLYSPTLGYKVGWYSQKINDSHLWNVFTTIGLKTIEDVTHWMMLPKKPFTQHSQ